jgi:hypothetical protein
MAANPGPAAPAAAGAGPPPAPAASPLTAAREASWAAKFAHLEADEQRTLAAQVAADEQLRIAKGPRGVLEERLTGLLAQRPRNNQLINSARRELNAAPAYPAQFQVAQQARANAARAHTIAFGALSEAHREHDLQQASINRLAEVYSAAPPAGVYIEYDTELLRKFDWRPTPKESGVGLTKGSVFPARKLSWSRGLGPAVDLPADSIHASSVCASDFQNLAARVSALLFTHGRLAAIDQVSRCIDARRVVSDAFAAKFAADIAAGRRGDEDVDEDGLKHEHAIKLLEGLRTMLTNPANSPMFDHKDSNPYIGPTTRIVWNKNGSKKFDNQFMDPATSRKRIHDHLLARQGMTPAQRAAINFDEGAANISNNPMAVNAFVSTAIRDSSALIGGPAQQRPRGGRTTRRKNGRRRTQKKRKTYV